MSLCKCANICDDWKKIEEGSLPDSNSIKRSHYRLCTQMMQYHCDLREKCIFQLLLNGSPRPIAQA